MLGLVCVLIVGILAAVLKSGAVAVCPNSPWKVPGLRNFATLSCSPGNACGWVGAQQDTRVPARCASACAASRASARRVIAESRDLYPSRVVRTQDRRTSLRDVLRPGTRVECACTTPTPPSPVEGEGEVRSTRKAYIFSILVMPPI